MKKYKNFIFDLYGTLVDIHTDEDSQKLWDQMSQLYQSYGAIYKPMELKYAFRRIERDEKAMLMNKHLSNASSTEKYYEEIDILNVFERLFTEKNTIVSKDTVISMAYTFRMLSRAYIRCYKNVKELLVELKKIGNVYLLSNAQAVFTEPEIRLLGLDQYFDDMFLSSDFEYRKPDGRYLLKLIEKHDLNKEECIMIGNDVHDDIGVANAAGIDSIYIHSNLSGKYKLPIDATYIIKNGRINQIKQILLNQ